MTTAVFTLALLFASQANCLQDCIVRVFAIQKRTAAIPATRNDLANAATDLRKAGFKTERRSLIRDYVFLDSKLEQGPVIIKLKGREKSHAVVIEAKVGNGYRYWDPKYPDHRLRMTVANMEQEWIGGALFIKPEEKKR